MIKLKKAFKFLGLMLLIVCLSEFVTYHIQSHRLIKEGYSFANTKNNKPPYPVNIKTFSNYYAKSEKNDLYTNNAGLNYKKNPVIVFGDVYANSIDSQYSFTKKLSQILKCPVYNFAEAGWGIPHMYYLLKSEEFLSNIANPSSIIYVYVNDQKRRMTSFSFYPHHNYLNLKYKIEDGVLVEDIPQFLAAYNLYSYRAFERYSGLKQSDSKNPNTQQKNFNLIKRLFEESKNIAQTRYHSINKFIILRFVSKNESLQALKDNENSAVAQLEYNMWELSDKNYESPEFRKNDSSPSDEALDEILPLFTEKAGLQTRK